MPLASLTSSEKAAPKAEAKAKAAPKAEAAPKAKAATAAPKAAAAPAAGGGGADSVLPLKCTASLRGNWSTGFLDYILP